MTIGVSKKTSSFFHPQALVDSDQIGEGTRVWAFAHVMSGAQIGAGCNIGEHAFIESGARIGNHVVVKNGVSVWVGVTVEDHVFLGPHCVLTNDPTPRSYIKKGPEDYGRTLIREGATIGAGAIVVCGTTIGCYAFVGAGTVVIRSVPDYALMVGNPARQIGWMCYCAKKLPLPAIPVSDSICNCQFCGRKFRYSEAKLREIG